MRLGIGAALIAAALALASCAGGQRGGESQQVIRPIAQVPGQATAAPRVVYVEDFAIDPTIVRTASDLPSRIIARRPLLGEMRDRTSLLRPTDSSDPAAEARRAINQLAESIVNGLGRGGVSAQRIAAGAPVPPDAWVVRGQIDQLSEGNRTEQAVVGLGAGGPQVEVSGYVDASQGAVLTFGDQARTHRMPGAAATRNPYAIAARFVLTRGATSRDVEQLGGNLAQEIVSYMRSNGMVR